MFSVVLSLCPYCFKGDILLSQGVICPLIQSAMLLLPMPADADAGSCLPLCSWRQTTHWCVYWAWGLTLIYIGQVVLVAAYSFLSHEVGVGAAPSRRTIFVVNVYHYVVVGTLAHGAMQPCCPLLRTYLNKAKLDAAEATLHKVDSHLVVVVAYLCIFAI